MEKQNKKENTTKYAENVCTEFKWLSPDKQKEKSEWLNKITKTKKKKKS